uniref:Coatomer subunit zeta n=1 Tax=Ursus maritimus TaxID=29073 RepID=A0A452ULH0_URSMA
MELQEPSLYTIKAVFILDNDGHRLLAKYYDDTFPSLKEQMAFEKNVFNKTSRTDSKCPPLPCRVSGHGLISSAQEKGAARAPAPPRRSPFSVRLPPPSTLTPPLLELLPSLTGCMTRPVAFSPSPCLSSSFQWGKGTTSAGVGVQ